MAVHWKEIGIILGLSAYQLCEIQKENDTVADCLNSVLQVWICRGRDRGLYGVPSWRTLCEAVKQVNVKVFKEISKNHRKISK